MLFKLDNLKLDNFQKYYLHFAIAKAYEDTNNYDKSYENLNIGNSLKEDKSSNFDIQKEIKLFSDIKSAFSNINLFKF